MAAPGPPVIGTVQASTTNSVAPTRPASIAANDIEVVYAVNHQPVSVGTISWPAGFTEGRQVSIKDSSGVVVGTAGWAWRRAAGGESGAVTCTRTGDTGVDSCFLANICRIPGCVATGTPYETETVNNPNASTTIDHPSVTVASTEFLSLLIGQKGGLNSNYSVPAAWTGLTSNASTSGTDAAQDADYRQVTTGPGTFDPPNSTHTTDADVGFASFHIAFIATALTESHSGSSSVRGGGSASHAGNKKGGVAVSSARGGGAAVSAVRKGAVAASSVRGGGSVVSVGAKGVEAHSGTSSVRGGGSASSSVRKGGVGASSARGGGSVSGATRKGGTATSTVRGGGSVTGTTSAGRVATSTVRGGGSAVSAVRKGGQAVSSVRGGGFVVSVGTQLQARSGTSSVRGGGTVIGTGTAARSSSSTVRGGGTVSGATRKGATATSSVRGGGTVSSTGTQQVSKTGTSSVRGGGSVAGVGRKATSSTSSARGGGTVTGVGRKSSSSSSTVRGGGFVVSTGSQQIAKTGSSTVRGGGSSASAGFKAARSTPTVVYADTFSGPASSSAGWPIYLRSTTTGTGADLLVSTTANYGRLSLFAASAGARKIVVALRAENAHDSMQAVDFRDFSTVSKLQALVARHAGASANGDHYRAVLEFLGTSNRFRLEKVVSGAATVLAQTTEFDADLEGDLRVVLEVVGTTIRAKAWLLTGSEPGAWTLEAVDAAIAGPGKGGLLLDGPDSQTTSADFDNYAVVYRTLHGAATVRGGGSVSSSGRKAQTAASSVRGGGFVTSTARKTVAATSRVTGGGYVTSTTISGQAAAPPLTWRTGTGPANGRTSSRGDSGLTVAGGVSSGRTRSSADAGLTLAGMRAGRVTTTLSDGGDE